VKVVGHFDFGQSREPGPSFKFKKNPQIDESEASRRDTPFDLAVSANWTEAKSTCANDWIPSLEEIQSACYAVYD
jgi:hypothetical protein